MTEKLDVTEKTNEIKQHMPETYKSIQLKAQAKGNVAFELVRRGLRGEANTFYAFEGGRVVGTPFTDAAINRDVSLYLVEFGCKAVALWGEPAPVAGVAA
jgi:hypothetical protein